jgi:hypothetical protein
VFLQLLAIVIRGRLLDLLADLRATTLDAVFLAAAVDDRGVLFLDTDALRLTQHVERDVLDVRGYVARIARSSRSRSAEPRTAEPSMMRSGMNA